MGESSWLILDWHGFEDGSKPLLEGGSESSSLIGFALLGPEHLKISEFWELSEGSKSLEERQTPFRIENGSSVLEEFGELLVEEHPVGVIQMNSLLVLGPHGISPELLPGEDHSVVLIVGSVEEKLGVEVKLIPGSHWVVMKPPCVKVLGLWCFKEVLEILIGKNGDV